MLDALLDLAGHQETSPEARAVAESELQALSDRLAKRRAGRGDGATAAHVATARRDIARSFAGEDAPDKRPQPDPIPLPWP